MANIKQQPLDENGNAHGEWVIYHTNGSLMYRWNFIHGINHGLHEGYNSNGTLSLCGYWNMGREIGYWYYDFQPISYFLWLI